MEFCFECDSDTGIVKKVNQDSIGLCYADTVWGKVFFSVMCDGMGGFVQGELASISVVIAFMKWFKKVFLKSASVIKEKSVYEDWNRIISEMNYLIYKYGKDNNIQIGTTAIVMLLWNNKFHILNVGDCRAYELKQNIMQITRDHSWVEREVAEGRMTKEEARYSNKKNILLKCIGGRKETSADIFNGDISNNAVYMLCCDGVRNKVNDDELFYFFYPDCMTDAQAMKNNIKYIFELNKFRKESDNMSVILVKAKESGNKDDSTKRRREKESIILKSIIISDSEKYLETMW